MQARQAKTFFFILMATATPTDRTPPSENDINMKKNGIQKPRQRRPDKPDCVGGGAGAGAECLRAPRESNDKAKRNATQKRRRPSQKKRHHGRANGTTPEPHETPTKPKPRNQAKRKDSAGKAAPAPAPPPKPAPEMVSSLPLMAWRVLNAAADQAKRKGKAEPRRTATH